MEIVDEAGFDGLTLKGLAESLGLVTTAIYRYFPSKDALSAALQRRAIAEIGEHLAASDRRLEERCRGAAPATAALAHLLGAADLYLGLPRTHARSWMFIAILLGDPRPLLSDEEVGRTGPILTALLTQIEALFERAKVEGALEAGPSKARMMSYWAAIHGAQCLEKARRLDRSLPPFEDVGAHAARSLLLSWGASGARLSAAERLLGEGR
jgi:AcrR family transcriptional regulator